MLRNFRGFIAFYINIVFCFYHPLCIITAKTSARQHFGFTDENMVTVSLYLKYTFIYEFSLLMLARDFG